MEDRKKDHIELAFESQSDKLSTDRRFWYEPLLGSHNQCIPESYFAGFHLKAPLWVSSMTGGTSLAKTINQNLAKACNEFGFGMGLGSCRILLNKPEYFPDFDVKDIVGENPLFANIGICQLEESLRKNRVDEILDLIKNLKADGLAIHVNPMQEWIQPEGDSMYLPPLETIKNFLSQSGDLKIIVKEVGQGMGKESLRELLQLPIEAIEFGAFGGTNFAKVELLRNAKDRGELLAPLAGIGHTAEDMLNTINQLTEENIKIKCKGLIPSGGVKTFLDGYYLVQKSVLPAIYGMGSTFLKYARGDYKDLQKFIAHHLKGLQMAYSFLKVRDE